MVQFSMKEAHERGVLEERHRIVSLIENYETSEEYNSIKEEITKAILDTGPY